MNSLLRDLRQALRGLSQAPAFAAIAILTLGLGIGANTAIFSVVDAVLLRPLPFPHPEQLMSVRESSQHFPSMSVAFPDYLDWVKDNHSFTLLSAYRGTGAIVTHAGPPAVINGEEATWQYFPVLGVQPELGRTYTAAEDAVGAPDVVVISDALWRSRLQADPAVIGKQLELDSRPRTIVGVMPPGFPGLSTSKYAPQFWVPLGAVATKDSGMMNRGSHPGLTGLGRLKPGVSMLMARADLNGIARNLAQQYPKSNTGEGVVVDTYHDRVVRNDGPSALWTLLGAVSLVLLIACANVANLLLARAATRQKPNAIRSALGASRWRLVREHLSESLCLGVGGSLLGLGLAWAAMRAAPALLPPELGMNRTDQIALDWRVLVFTIALALATTLIFGFLPAWHASRTRIGEVLKDGGRESSASRSGGRLRNLLVGLEMALALVLLVGAGLLIRSLVQLQQVNPGFDPNGVLTFELSLPSSKYPKQEQTLAFFRQAVEKISQLPGVSAVGTVDPLPFNGSDWENSFSVVGRPEPGPGQMPSTNWAMVSGDYFHAMGMHLLRGRLFNENDTLKAPRVAIIDASFARAYWPGADPIGNALGQQIRSNGSNWTIVGVVARVLNYGLDQTTEMDKLPETFVPLAQLDYNMNDSYVALRTTLSDPMQLRTAVTSVVQSLDAQQPLYDMLSMDARIGLSLAQRRLTLWLMIGFAGLALILAAIGIYGVLSYAVAQRTHELGLRMALGAGRPRVLRLVLRQGLTLALAGAVAGLAVAMVLGRWASSFLFGVSRRDPLTLVAVPLLLLAIAALACYLPARRATRVDPMIALRGE